MKVFITDDHELIIDGVKAILKTTTHEVVGSATTGSELVEWLDTHECDVVLLDLKLPDMTGIDILKRFFGKHNAPKFLIVSSSCDLKQIQETIMLGASGYISKVELSKELEDALLKLGKDRRFYSDSIIDIIISNQMEQEDLSTLQHMMTEKEAETLKVLNHNIKISDQYSFNEMKRNYDVSVLGANKVFKMKKKFSLAMLAIKHKLKIV